MDSISSSSLNNPLLQQQMESQQFGMVGGMRPEPGPQPMPGPTPPMPPQPGPTPGPEPYPSGGGSSNNDDFLRFVHSMTPYERADATPTTMQLENLEMARNYQQDYEDAANSDGSDDGSSSSSDQSNGGLSSPQFYEDMYKTGKAYDANEWVQGHLNGLEQLNDFVDPIKSDGNNGNNGNLLQNVHSMTPYERADATPTTMQLENLEMARNYQKDYEDAANANGTGNGNSSVNGADQTSGGLSSPQFYEDMYKTGKAYDANEWVQGHLYNMEQFSNMADLFKFNSNAMVNIGSAAGLHISPDMLAQPAYMAAMGQTGPIPNGGVGMSNYLSPENVASRTVDMVASLYGGGSASGTGSEGVSSRQDYVDGMRDMIGRSYEQARSGSINANTPGGSSVLDQTNTLISQGLDNFVQNGLDPQKNVPGGLYDQLRVMANDSRTSYGPEQDAIARVAAANPAISGLKPMIDAQA